MWNLRFDIWDGIISHADVGSWWYSKSVISKSRAFQRCIIRWFIWNFYNFYLFKFLRFGIVFIHMRISDHVGSSDFFKSCTCSRFEVWDSINPHEDVGSWWHSDSMISKSRAFQWCIISWFFWNFYNLYMFKVMRFQMVQFHMRLSDHSDIQNLWSLSQVLLDDVSYVGLSETFILFTCLSFSGLR